MPVNAVLLLALAALPAAVYGPALERARAEQDVPGVSAVVTLDDRVLFAGASGVADIESGRAMTPDSVLYAGSLTKVLTAVLALNLVEDGRLALDAPVPAVAVGSTDAAPGIRVVHLLTHAAGLEREGGFGYWFSGEFPDAEALENHLRDARLLTPPGTALHYSNLGYAALGLVIERAAGRPYAASLRRRVLEPLGMRSSGAPGPAPGVASGYTPVGRILPDADRPFAGIGHPVGERFVRAYHDAAAMSPAFGAYTSASDLGRLTRFLLGHGGDGVLSRAMRARMRTAQASGWGLGLRLGALDGRTVARHSGWFAAHRSHLLLDPANGIGVAVLANSDGAAPADIAEVLLRVALAGTGR